MANPTAGPAVRAKCRECLGIEKGQKAYDAGCVSCVLYACNPFRGQLLPTGQRPTVGYDETAETARLAVLHAQVPKRQPSVSLCAKHCWDCNGDSREDCGATTCPLFPFRPMQEGGRPRKQLTGEALETARERGRELAARHGHEANNRPDSAPGPPAQATEAQAPLSLSL